MKKIMPYIIIIGLVINSTMLIACADDVTTPIDMGTIPYRDFEYIMFTSNEEVDLNFVSSEYFNSDALTVQNIDYYPSTNETKYKFTSNDIVPDSWFTSGDVDFIYQDMNTGQLYKIIIDYTGIEIPESYWESSFKKLNNSYSQICLNYTVLNDTYNVLKNISNHINDTLQNYKNCMNQSIDKNVELLLNEYNNLDVEIGFIRIELDRLQEIENNFNELTKSYSTLLNDYDSINESYNTTYNNMMNYSTQLSGYKSFEDKINNGISGFYFKDRYYRTKNSYNTEIKKLEESLGLTPFYIILAVILTIVFAFFIANKHIQKLKKPFDEETSIDEKANRFNIHLLSKLKETFTPARFQKEPKSEYTTTMKTNDTIPSVNNSNVFEDKIKEIENKTDTQYQELKQDMTRIHDSIDLILQKNGTPISGDTGV